MKNIIPRDEHPNPQFKRENFENLNGKWQFEIDNAQSGLERGILTKEKYDSEINVPFCPESILSGIANKDFMYSVWYKREIYIPQEKIQNKIFLHFGAVDYIATIYINGSKACTHTGGFSPFEVDLTNFVRAGENTIVVNAVDFPRTYNIPSGKQSKEFNSHNCEYTRTTGIWQTVWLEYVPNNYIKNFKFYPDVLNTAITITAELSGYGEFCVEITYNGKPMASCRTKAAGFCSQTLTLSEGHLWEVGHGRLYDVKLSFDNDNITSYFGLRSTRIDGMKYLLNEKAVFQRTVLDQGYYPDGIMTAPSEQALIDDIEMSIAIGFNGARLHQKVFEPLFLYHCDRLGYIVWGEYPSWGIYYTQACDFMKMMPEWREIVKRDFNHPSIIGWCPLNEVWKDPDFNVLNQIYLTTKCLDPTRPCIDASGGYHSAETDIFDIHDYEQNPTLYEKNYSSFKKGDVPKNQFATKKDYNGQALFVSEFGGIAWNADNISGWGYGIAPKTKQEYIARYAALSKILLDNENLIGFCYTQLYDIEQEINGIFTYSRKPKFSLEEMSQIKAANTAPAAIEKL